MLFSIYKQIVKSQAADEDFPLPLSLFQGKAFPEQRSLYVVNIGGALSALADKPIRKYHNHTF